MAEWNSDSIKQASASSRTQPNHESRDVCHAHHVDDLAQTPGFERLRDEIISRARPKARESEITNMEVVVADARKLPLPDASIDLALSNYCVHHIKDADKLVGLSELAGSCARAAGSYSAT